MTDDSNLGRPRSPSPGRWPARPPVPPRHEAAAAASGSPELHGHGLALAGEAGVLEGGRTLLADPDRTHALAGIASDDGFDRGGLSRVA